MGEHRLETFEFEVGDYQCKARALSIGEWEELNEGALPFIDAQVKEDILLACLLEPSELKEEIASGEIAAGIPLLIFDAILASSGFDMPREARDAYLEQAREYISTSVVESCKVLILAAGIATLSEIYDMSLTQALELVALAENVLNIQQQNLMAAMAGGQPIKLVWDGGEGGADIQNMHQEKAAEVQSLIDQQIGNARGGMGVRLSREYG